MFLYWTALSCESGQEKMSLKDCFSYEIASPEKIDTASVYVLAYPQLILHVLFDFPRKKIISRHS